MNETLCLVLKDLKSKKLTLEEIKKKIRPLSKNNGSPLISLIHLFAKVNKAKRIAIHNILLAISSFLKLLRKKVLITTTTVDEKMWEEFNFFWEGLEYTIENTDVIHKKERHIVTILACLIDLNFAVENESRFDVNSRLAFLNEQKKDMDLDVLLHCKTLILPQYRQIKLYFCVLRSTLQAHPVKQWCSATELLKLCLLGKLLKLSADNGSKKSKLLLLDYQHKLKKQSPLLDVLVSHEEFGFIFTKANSIKSLIKTINVPAVYKLLYSSKGNCTLDDAVSNEGKQLCEKPSEETANDAALKKKAKKLISLERDKDLLPGTRTFLSKKLSSRSRDVHMPDTLINGDTAVECLHAKISYHLSELGGRLDKSPWIKDWIKKTLKSKNKESKAKCFASTFLKDFEQVYQLQKELEKNICNCKNCTSKNMESSVDKASRNVERSLDKDSSNVDRSIYKTSKNVDRAGDKTSKNVDRSVDKAYESVVKPLEFKESDLSKELQLFDEKLDKATSKCSVLKSKPVNLEEPAFSKDWKLFDEKLDKDNHKLLKPKPIKIKAQNFSKELFDLSNNQVNDVGIKLRKPVVGSISEKNSSDETQEYANKKTYKKIDEMLSKSKDNEYVTNIISGKQKPKSGRHGDELKASNKRQKHGDKMNVPSFQEQKLKPVVGPEEVGQLSMPSGSSTNLSLEKMETVSNRAKTKTEKRKKIRWRKLKKMKSINDTLVEEMCLTEKVEKITSSPSDNESDSSKNAKVEDNESDSSKNAKVEDNESDSSKNAKVEDNESDSSKNAKVEDNESDSSKNAKVEDNESDSWNTTKVEVTGSESRKRENLDDIESDTSIWKKAKLYNSDGTPAKVRKPRWKKCISVVAEQPRVIPVREAAEDEMSAKCREKSKDFWNDLMGINSGSTKRRRKRNRRKQRMSNTAGSDDNDVEIVELNSSEVFPPTTKDDIVVENGRVCVPYDEGGKSLDNKKSKNERRRKRAKQKRMKEMSKIEERSKVVTGTEAMAMEKDAKVERDLLLSFYKSSPVNTANFQEISCHGNVDDDGDDAEALKVVYETVAFDMSKNNVTMKKQDNQPLLNMLPNIKKKTVIDKVTHSKDGRNTLHKQPDAGINVFETSSPPTGLEHSDDVNSQLSRDISSGSPNHKEASFLQMSKVESLPLCIPSQDTSSHIHICKEHEVIHCDRWNMETEKCQSLNENVQCRENGIGEPHFELPLPELMDYKCINVQMLNSHAPPRLSGDIKALMDSTETKQMLSKNITKRNKRHRMLPSLSAASIMNEDSISSTSDDAEEAYEAGSSDASDNSIYKKLKLKTQKKSQPEEVLNSSQKKKRRSSTPSEGLSLKSSARSPTAQTPLTPVTLSPRSNSTQSPKSDRNHVESPSIISHRGDTLLSPVISNPQIDSISPLITARDFSKSPSAIALSSVKSVSPVLLSSTSLMTRDSPFKSQLEIDETSSELTSVIASNCIAKSSRNLEKDLNSNESPCNVQSANEEVTLMEEQAVKKWYHPLLDSLPSDQSEENSDEAQSTEGGSNFMAATSVQDSPGTDSLGDTLNANQVADECILSSGLDGCISPTPPVEKHLHSVPSPVLIRRFTFNIKSKIKRNSMKLSSSLGTSLETELCECLENSMSLNDSNCSLNVNEQEGEEVEVLSSSSSETELTQIDNISVTPPSSLTNHFPVDFTSDRMDAEMGQRSQKKYVYKKPSKSVQDIVIPSKRNFVDFPTPQKVASEALLGSELIISPGVSDEENEVGKEINSKVKIIENLPQFDQPYPWIRSKSPEKITQEEQTEDDFDKGAEEISVFDSPLKSTNKSATRKLFSPIKSIRATPQKTRSKRIPQKSPKSPISKSPIAKSPFLSSSKSQVVKSPSHSSSKSPVAKSPSHSSSKSPVAKSPSHSSSKSPVAKSPSHSSSKSPVAKSPSHSSKLTQDRGEVMRTPTRKSRMAKISDSEDRDTVSSTPTRIMTRGCKVTIPQFASATELPSMGSFTPSRRRTSNTPNLTPVRRSRRLSGLPTELSEGIIKKFF